ncbi:MAG TPA: hypothetical protein VFU33_04660 [Gaiellaceae bacterium]|nr:hypothetical protein [Gaiellaceae bacterium]
MTLSFSLDPLLAEAKRRARQRRAFVALAVGAAVAAAAVLGVELRGLGSVTPVPAKLTVLAVRENGGRALFHFSCEPAGGDVAQPARACAAIAAQPSLVTNPKPFFDGGSNGAYFTITGRLDGKPVHFSGESDWTPQMELIQKLGLAGANGQPLHLEPRRHGFVGVGQTRTFAPGVLRPGDLVTCRVHHSYPGLPLAMSVPIHRGFGNMIGAAPGVMAVRVRAGGAVVASCLARDRLPLSKRGRTRLPDGWPP